MSNAEMQLISRIVRTGDLAPVVEWGISSYDFGTLEARAAWEAIAGYYISPASKAAVLGDSSFHARFPHFPISDDLHMTTEALCLEVRRSRVIREGKAAAIAFSENVEIDPTAALSEWHTHSQRLLMLGTTKNADMNMNQAVQRLKQRYELLKTNQFAYAKALWPWPVMNEATNGIQEDDFVCFYGRPKSMKTWVLNVILSSVFEQGKKALVYTKEMTPDNIFQRIAACILRIPYQELRNGKLAPEDERRIDELLVFLDENLDANNVICLSGRDCEPGGDTVPWIQSKVEKYKPDVVFIDGMYLLSDSLSSKRTQDWQRVMNISRAIRQMILTTRTPVICTMQANRAAAKHNDANLDEIAYSDALSQDVTVAARVINEKNSPTIAMILAGSREFKLHGVRIYGIPATDFTFHSVMSEKETLKAKEEDGTGEETPEEAATRHAKKRAAPKIRVADTQANPVLEQRQQESLNGHMQSITP